MNLVRKFHCTNTALLIIRVVTGGLFLYAGLFKLMNMEMTISFFQQVGLTGGWAWVVALVETVGGAFAILGVFTSVSALGFVVIMVVAIILSVTKANLGFAAIQPNILLLATSLGLLLAGPGRYALSKLWCKCECGVCKDGMCLKMGKCHKGDQGMPSSI